MFKLFENNVQAKPTHSIVELSIIQKRAGKDMIAEEFK